MESKERMNKLESYIYSLDANFHNFLNSISLTAEKLNEILKIIHEEDFAKMPISAPEKAYEVLLSVTMAINSLFVADTFQYVLKLLEARQEELKGNTNLS